MQRSTSRLARFVQRSVLVSMVLTPVAIGALNAPVGAADPSPSPVVASSPAPTEPADAMCASVANLRLYVGFVRSQSIKDDGLLPVLVGVVASLSEARALAGLVSQTYRPLVDNLVTSLTDLETSVRTFFDQGTVGAGLVQLGGAIGAVGTQLDALSSAVKEPCPDGEPGPSMLPVPSASPSA
jgi:hypothetical protein